ncbi:MAG: four helix bundle protein [Chitinophagaceae bacterium]|nr:four helix bundle protein [Chitinophagaceae bacterium]MCW5904646.1 four helix bundle protein [Chitinophagaceae bacterium]
MAFKFENLKIWQVAIDLADDIDKLALTFPKHELYSLSSQIKRAADSVSLNIVEGSTGQSNAEFKRLLRISNRSALEVVGCLFLAKRRNYINNEDFTKFYNQIETLVKMIQALINSIND